MAQTYADIIKIRPGKPAYNIIEEKADEWNSFIPNEQFNGVLKIVIRSVRGNDIDAHKSFWINGTYGTGKSHAAAVIAHLLGDPIDALRDWIDYEYGDERFATIRQSIYALRQQKRLLPIQLKGMENLTHVSELAPLFQTKVLSVLEKQQLSVTVETDYDTMIHHITDHPVIWDDLIARNTTLSTIVADRTMLLRKLNDKDPATLQKARVALREANIMIMMPQENLGNWLIEVQDQLRHISPYTGLLIVWDEFTEVMEDAIGISILKGLQAVAEKFMNEENDSFLFLISHPSAFNKIGAEDTKQTDGRYHRMKYNMESVSAFKIMSRKFEIVDPERHQQRCDLFYTIHPDLLDYYSTKSNDIEETQKDLFLLFPIHPGTANLATHYATTVGSSSRSVFEFIGDNEDMRAFLSDPDAYACKDTITADFLWNFVLKEFQDDVINYGAVTERYNTYRLHVEQQGQAAEAIFKAILLLNAFNNVAADDTVTPTADNIRHLFSGTKYENNVDEVLEWINDQSIIQRVPGDIYSVQFSALPSGELEENKNNLRATEYRFTSQVLHFGDTATEFFRTKYIQKVWRPVVFDFYSEDQNNAILRSKIKAGKRNASPSDLFLALLFARNLEELKYLQQFAEECNQAAVEEDKELRDIVFVVVDTPFSDRNFERFIEYMASYTAAQKHGFADQTKVHRDHATEMIREWILAAQRSNATLYVNGQNVPIALRHLSSTLCASIAPTIFPYGPDAEEALRTRSAATFWKPLISKDMVRTMLTITDKSELQNVNGQMRPITYLVQDALDENLCWKADCPAEHPLRKVYDFVNSTIKNFISHGNTAQLFDLTERFDALTRPPYGLSANYASAAMVAFAMRPWINKIYDQVGKPRNAENLTDDIALLINFWDKGKTTSKLSFKFQTPQEGKLCKQLISLFRLNKLQGYSDISSMKDARYAITGVFLEQQGYPLWSIKYLVHDDSLQGYIKLLLKDDMLRLIDNIVAICHEQDTRNVQLVTSTLELLAIHHYDLTTIIFQQNAFRHGFEQFLLYQPEIGIRPEEVDDAIVYLRQHLESTVGYWTETEVATKLPLWRIAQQKATEQARREQEEEALRRRHEDEWAQLEAERQQHAAEVQEARRIIGDRDNIDAKSMQAREHISAISDPETLHRMLNRLIDLGYERILDTILDTHDDHA